MLSNKKIICPNNLIKIAKKSGTVDAANLIGWWKLNEGSGTLALNSSINRENGILNGPIHTKGRFNENCLDSFHREWRPDWNEIENPINNDRRIINENK